VNSEDELFFEWQKRRKQLPGVKKSKLNAGQVLGLWLGVLLLLLFTCLGITNQIHISRNWGTAGKTFFSGQCRELSLKNPQAVLLCRNQVWVNGNFVRDAQGSETAMWKKAHPDINWPELLRNTFLFFGMSVLSVIILSITWFLPSTTAFAKNHPCKHLIMAANLAFTDQSSPGWKFLVGFASSPKAGYELRSLLSGRDW
jgi:hypothetical protein